MSAGAATITASGVTDAPDAVRPVVRAVGLRKVLDERVVLDGLSFDIPPASFVALLGANGAGKSTLLRVLALLTPPTEGTLEVLGGTARAQTVAARARLGMIGHDAMLYRSLTVRENLVFFGRLYGIADPGGRAEALLARVDLAERGDDVVGTFSRGMLQRASIARALMHDPALLLADEPFTGLDPPSRRRLEQLLRGLRESGKTIILANHDVEQSLALAERALILRGGRLALDRATRGLDPEAVLAEVGP